MDDFGSFLHCFITFFKLLNSSIYIYYFIGKISKRVCIR